MDGDHLPLRVFLFVILTLICAVFSGTSVAISAMGRSALSKKAEAGDERSARVLELAKKPSVFLSMVDMIVTAASIITGSYAAGPFVRNLHDVLRRAGLGFFFSALFSHLIVWAVIIYVITVFGMLFPKRLAHRHYEGWIRVFYRPVAFLNIIFRPFIALIGLSVKGLEKAAGLNTKNVEENVTEEEIIMMVSEGHEQGVIEENEAEMISNIFEFDDKDVSDIMTHRRNVISIDASLSISRAAEFMASEPYSRYPVYEDDEDNIIGILHLKDVMRMIVHGEKNVHIKEIMRKPMFVPDTQSINSLFNEMQAKKVHMAIVVDEYGQSVGLVAMEDILEEIVGNIMDEYDRDEHFIQSIGDGWYMRGMTPLEDITDLLGIEFSDDFDTLNGYLIAKLNRIPSASEGASVDVDGYNFRIAKVRDNMITLVRVTKNTEEAVCQPADRT